MGQRTTHYSINPNQLRTLKLLYKFRYITIPLLTEYKNLTAKTTIMRNLDILVEQGYITKQHDASYRINHKPALYYLSNKGASHLRKASNFNPQVLHSYYKNSSLSDEFKQHSLYTVATYNTLHGLYGDSYDMFTSNELAGMSDFPKKKPDIYIRSNKTSQEYFLSLVHDVPQFIVRKQFTSYVDHSEDEGWPGGVYPTLLYVLKSSSDENKFIHYAKSVLENAGISQDELCIASTTTQPLLTKPYNRNVWRFMKNSRILSELI